MTVTHQPAQRETWAVDLLEHPGFRELLHDIEVEATAARRVIFAPEGASAEEEGLAAARARGSLKALFNVVLSLYVRANVPIPPAVESLFR